MRTEWQHKIAVVPSTYYQVMKFHASDGKFIIEFHGGQVEAIKDSIIIIESVGVPVLPKLTFKDKPTATTTELIKTKKVNINI